ncbi:MAG: hypothetical protein ACT4NP_13835 [Pseudonocardiales bacterium]
MAPTVISTRALVGRDAELATARRLLDASRAGEGGLLLVTGAAYGAGHPDHAAGFARTAAEMAERFGEPETLCAALLVLGRCTGASDRERAVAAFGRAAQCAAEHGLAIWRIEATCGLGLVELHERDVPVLLGEAHELALDAGLLGLALSIEVILAERVLTTDGPRAAESMSQATAKQADLLGLSGLQAAAEASAAAGRAAAGDLDSRDALLDAASQRAHASIEVTALAAAARALPHLLAHDLRRADALLDGGMIVLRGHASAAPITYWGLWALLRMIVAMMGSRRSFCAARRSGLRLLTAPRFLTPMLWPPAAPARTTSQPTCLPPATRSWPVSTGGAGCCDCSSWRRRWRIAGVTRCPRCVPISPPSSAAASTCWPAPAVTCYAGPAPRPGGDAAVLPSRPLCGLSG